MFRHHHSPQEIYRPEIRLGMSYLMNAASQLRSFDARGSTVFALTVSANQQGAALYGPAISVLGITPDWPAEFQSAAMNIYNKQSSQDASTVVVILIVRNGYKYYCTIVTIPYSGKRRRACKTGNVAVSCAELVLDIEWGYITLFYHGHNIRVASFQKYSSELQLVRQIKRNLITKQRWPASQHTRFYLAR